MSPPPGSPRSPRHMAGRMPPPPGSPRKGSPRNKKQQRAATLEEWFDSGLTKTESHVGGLLPLPHAYQGATADQLLLSQQESDTTVWPVRIDIGDLEKGKGLRKLRTLYHYMSETSFDKARTIFSKGENDVPLKILRLLKEDNNARSAWDASNPQREIRANAKEPLFATKGELLQAVIGMEDPVGQDSNGVELTDIADYCISFRVANVCVDKLDDDDGRGQVKLIYEDLIKQCYDLQKKAGLDRAKSVASLTSEEARAIGLTKKVPLSTRLSTGLLKIVTSLQFDSDKARQRAGKKLDKSQRENRQWEKEKMWEVKDKEAMDNFQAIREARIDAVMERRGLGGHSNQNKGQEGRSNSPKRGSISVAGPKSPKSPRRAATNPYANIKVDNAEPKAYESQDRQASPRASLAMKYTGSWQKRRELRASVAEAAEATEEQD